MKTFWKILPVVVTAIILCFKEWETFQHINTVLFGDYHDALKNYYTILYHVKWDSSYFHFEGMNYPYGEHVLFTDNQPLISNTLRFIQRNLFDVTPYLVGIINSLLFISFLFSAWFSNLSLRKLGTQPWLAALVSIGLVFLAPQINRLNGHFGLSYSFIIPMFFYLGLLHISRPHWRRSLLIGLATFGVGLLHAYNLGFALLITGTLFLVHLAYQSRSTLFSIGHFAVQAILPFAAIQLLMIFTDPISDRPAFPWSPFIGNFQPEGFLVSYHNPIGFWIHHNLHFSTFHWEAEAYLGMATLLMLIVIIFRSLPFFKKQRISAGRLPILHKPKMAFILFAGLAAVLLSLAFSLLSGFTEIYSLMGPLRQFRAVGRFHWVAFYAFNFFAFSWLSSVLLPIKQKWHWGLLAVLLGFLAFDAYYISNRPYHSEHPMPLFANNSRPQQEMHDLLQEYDVILPIPYFHIGSEDFYLQTDDSRFYKNAMGISYASGLPLAGNMLSRTSLSQTLALISYRVWPLETPPFEAHLKGKKVILLVQKESVFSLNEKLLLSAGGLDTVYEDKEFYLQNFDLNSYSQQHASQDSIHDYFKYGPKNSFVKKDYETSLGKSYRGAGSKEIIPSDKPIIESIEVPRKAVRTKIGFWVYLNQSTKALDNFTANFVTNSGIINSPARMRLADNLKAIDGNWGYFEMEMELPENSTDIQLISHFNNLNPLPTYLNMFSITFYNKSGAVVKN